MANVQPSNQQVGEMESLSNMLSPEAKEFVPRQFSGMPSISGPLTDGLLGPGPGKDQSGVNGLPSYITTCYPFVNAGEPRFGGVRPRHRGKYTPQQALYMSQQYQHIQPGISRNRFPHPSKGYVPTSGWGPTGIGDMMQSYGNVPNGMPFDGGTYQNGFIHTSQLTGSGDGKEYSSARQNFSGDNFIETPHLLNGFKEPVNQQWKTKHKSEANSDGTMKICYKSSSVQTDFPEHIASATLEESPNTLYNNGQVAYKDHHKPGSRRSRHSSNRSASDIDTEDGMLLGRNTVSNGTNPSTEFTEGICVASLAVSDNQFSHMTNNSGSLSSAYSVYSGATGFKGHGHNESSSTMHGTVNSVPYLNDSGVEPTFRRSYASIAQTNPSQTHKQNLVAAATDQGEQAICDNSVTISRTTSAKKYVKESSRSASRIGNVNVNVAEIMQDLERADKKLEDSAFNSENAYQKQHGESETGPVKFLYSAAVKELPKAENHISNVSTISQVSQRSSKVNEHKGHLTNSHCVYSGNERKSGDTELKSHHGVHQKSQLKGHPQVNISGQVKGQNFFSDSNKSDIDLDRKGHSLSDNNNNNQGEGEGKKKKRRRRRRKKKTGEVTAENEETVGASEEITLHFEDEEEFPDLSGCGGGCHPAISSQFPAATMSYSDIINNANTCNVQSTKTISPDEQFSPDTAGTSSMKESRSSRKRRKRREVANKAADAEMAEINLEQHMLELKMKQKLPLAAKKSVSPVRNAPSQGVWKLTPSSPASQSSSSGKKVSLLLPGTVATEPSHNSSPHQPNTSAVRQPGILKTSQATPPAQQSSAAQSGKKSKQPITYDFGALIDALESKKEQTPPPKKDAKSVVAKKDELKSLNALDSSAPAIKRGKERETPKIKKPSPLKKVILKEREEKKRLRLLDEDEVASGAPLGIGVVSGGESDLSQDTSFKGSMEVGLGTPASAELSPISQQSPSCMSPMSPGASPLSSGVNSPVTGAIQQTVKLKIHSRRFREYCNQVLDKEIDNHVTALLQDLVRFQDKQYHKDPVKAKAKRRFVLGLREVTKHLKLRKIKCVIISPNLEKIQSKGGLDDALNLILELCNDQKVPFIFALGRRALGRACAKLVPVSVVGVFNYEGSEENFKSLVALTEKARDAYREMIVQIEKEMADHPPRSSVPGVPHIFAHMGHSRTPSGCSVISFTSSILSEPISENYPHSEPETDNRGYEIEKGGEDIEDGAERFDDEGEDAYEADDERGYSHKAKKSKKVYSENIKNNTSVESGIKTEDRLDKEDIDVNGNNFDESLKNGVVGDTVNSSAAVRKVQGELDVSGQVVVDNDVEIAVDIDNASKVNLGDTDIQGSDSGSDFDSDDDSDSEDGPTDEGGDTVEALPTFIDSVHHFDLTEILSQHSSKTMENGEDVMSTHSSKTTHSSRTLGDSSGLAGDKNNRKLDLKSVDKPGTLPSIKTKSGVDKDFKEHRTQSWVNEAQNFNFNDQSESPRDPDENVVDVKNVPMECLDAVA